jgi:hypothetical protein
MCGLLLVQRSGRTQSARPSIRLPHDRRESDPLARPRLRTTLAAAPYLSLISNPLFGFAGAVVWVVIPSMTRNIADHIELVTRQRHEGDFASILS